MALGAQNSQQMQPAQFLSRVDQGRLVDPGNYSQPNFTATAFRPGDTMALVQDAMEKQAAYEAAYQARQNNLGWQILDNVQSALDKGVITAGKFADLEAQSLKNKLDGQFGEQERRADLEGKQASTAESKARAAMSEFDLGLKRKFGEEDTRVLIDQRKAQTEGTRADTAGKMRENELLGKYGERKLQAEIGSTEANTRDTEFKTAQTILEKEKERALFSIAAEESRRIHELYQKATAGETAGETSAYNRLFDYAIPADLIENPKLAAQLQEQLDDARRSAAGSKTIELSKKNRLAYEQFAHKLYTDGPKGNAFAAKVTGILQQNPGFLTGDQVEAIQNAYEVYRTRINPGTKVKLPEIVDTMEAAQGMDTVRVSPSAIQQAREADRSSLVRKPLSDSTTNATIRAWTTVLQDMTADQNQKDMALAILETVARRNPELLDPRILTMIQLKRASQGNTGTTKPNATQDNKANFNRFD